MKEPTIKCASFKGKGYITVTGYFTDKSEEVLFSFYDDEISFAESELWGLTAKEARQLFINKDKAYLRS